MKGTRNSWDSGVSIAIDGAFSLLLPTGTYGFSVMNISDRYVVSGITYGKADLVSGPLEVDGPPTAEFLITVVPI